MPVECLLFPTHYFSMTPPQVPGNHEVPGRSAPCYSVSASRPTLHNIQNLLEIYQQPIRFYAKPF